MSELASFLNSGSVNQKRRKLLKAAGSLPLLSFFSAPLLANRVQDVDIEIAELAWSEYRYPEEGDQPYFPRHQDADAEAALSEIAKPIMDVSTRSNLAWRIGLVESDQVNAVTPGGGVVFVFDKLIANCKSESQLASVIAHEVGHIEHRHAIQRIYAEGILERDDVQQNVDGAALKKAFDQKFYNLVSSEIIYKSYKRLWEHQADAFIIRAFERLNYSLDESHTFFENLITLFGSGSPDNCLFSTHPLTNERIMRLKNLSRAYAQRNTRGNSEAFNYLKSVFKSN